LKQRERRPLQFDEPSEPLFGRLAAAQPTCEASARFHCRCDVVVLSHRWSSPGHLTAPDMPPNRSTPADAPQRRAGPPRRRCYFVPDLGNRWLPKFHLPQLCHSLWHNRRMAAAERSDVPAFTPGGSLRFGLATPPRSGTFTFGEKRSTLKTDSPPQRRRATSHQLSESPVASTRRQPVQVQNTIGQSRILRRNSLRETPSRARHRLSPSRAACATKTETAPATGFGSRPCSFGYLGRLGVSLPFHRSTQTPTMSMHEATRPIRRTARGRRQSPLLRAGFSRCSPRLARCNASCHREVRLGHRLCTVYPCQSTGRSEQRYRPTRRGIRRYQDNRGPQ